MRLNVRFFYKRPSIGAALGAAPHLSVCLSVCPSRASDVIKIGKLSKLLIQWKHKSN